MADDFDTDAALAGLSKEELEELAQDIDPDVRKSEFWLCRVLCCCDVMMETL